MKALTKKQLSALEAQERAGREALARVATMEVNDPATYAYAVNTIRELEEGSAMVESLMGEPLEQAKASVKAIQAAIQRAAGPLNDAAGALRRMVSGYFSRALAQAGESGNEAAAALVVRAAIPPIEGVIFRENSTLEVVDAAALVRFLLEIGEADCLSVPSAKLKDLKKRFPDLPGVEVRRSHSLVLR